MTSQFDVRPAKAGDIPTLVRFLINLDAHVAGVAPDVLALTERGEQELQQRIESFIGEPGKRLVVACGPDGELVGMGDIHIWHYADLWLNPERQGLRSGYIDDLWVEPEYRTSGIGRQILEALFEYAAEQEIDELILEYALHNKEAEQYWSRLGFKPTGVRAAASLRDVRARLSDPGRSAPKRGHGRKKDIKS
jgi:ribosomal protein S18 acetylase RimI-like enzyme